MTKFVHSIFLWVVIYVMLVASSIAETIDGSQVGRPALDSPHNQRAMYLGNEALMIQTGETKILFDPFFHNDYGIYQLVPERILSDIYEGNPPFDGIKTIFVSHAHGDHFAADEMLKYLERWQNVSLIAPAQAVRSLKTQPGYAHVASRVTGVSLELGDPVWRQQLGQLEIDAVRIPHSGWPERANVENIVFRVKLEGKVSVTHLGDADADVSHYHGYRSHWLKEATDVAFPPYWFQGNPAGHSILHEHMNVKRAVGIHVPRQVPPKLKNSGAEYFSKPGEEKEL